MENTLNNTSSCNACTGLAIVGAVIALYFFKIWTNGGVNKKRRDLSNQVIIITGSNTGIGLETAKDCAKNGAKVIVACRDQKRGQNAVETVNCERPGSAEFMRLDLSDLSSVRLFANEFKSKYNRLDILINNAGIMHVPERVLTKDGFESHMATNHFGHFLLTHLLMDTLKKAPQFRVLNLSSLAHEHGPIVFEDINYEKRPYNRVKAYAQSKLANILFTIGLQKRIQQQNLNGISVSIHPGGVRTELSRHWSGIISFIKNLLYPLIYLITKSPLQGAQTTLYCVHEDFNKLVKGAYYADCKTKRFGNKQADDENAEKLWDISVKSLKL